MLEVFTYESKFGWHWYVSLNDHVLDQGFNRSVKRALNQAESSKDFLIGQLGLALEEDAA